ncbi:hypothetical protein KKD37_01130 [Patescibacteria group bacterium]|nr:hypothetical protein [Patescibacteria group bacterium]
MEKRNIQKTGGSSFSLTLPKTWIVNNCLENGGEVEIYTRNQKQLIIQPPKLVHSQSAILAIENLPDSHIYRELIGLYISGVDEINVTAKFISYEQKSLVRLICSKLIGFELFEESSNRILLKNVASPTITSKEYLNKMHQIIRSMFDDMVKAVDNFDRNLAKDIIGRDIEIDRIHLMIFRQFNSILTTMVSENSTDISVIKLHYYELVGLRLERLADHIVKIAIMVSKLKDKQKIVLNKFEHAYLTKTSIYLDTLPSIIFNLDKQAAHEILDIFDSRKDNDFIYRKIENVFSINILIRESVERIRSYVSNIAEETLNFFDS